MMSREFGERQMTGKKLKLFKEKLLLRERNAIKKLCEPDWDYEITGIKHGPSGVMLIVTVMAIIGKNCAICIKEKKGVLWENGKFTPLIQLMETISS